jgi:hypothetical protein
VGGGALLLGGDELGGQGVDGPVVPIDEITAELIAAEQQGPAPHRYIEVD